MGYYTYYQTVTVTDKANAIGDCGFNLYDSKISEEDLVKELIEISENDLGLNWSNGDYTFDNLLGDNMKWYDHDKHMLELSKRHPELYFRLSGEGEEREDMWEKVYHNGKVYEKQVEFLYPVWDETDIEED